MDLAALQLTLSATDAAVSHAQDVRKSYAKRAGRGDRQRQTDIQHALNRLKRVMGPIRSELARIPYQIRDCEAEATLAALEQKRTLLASASDGLQRERRKLWKMQEHKGRKNGKRGTRR